jgi:hypothetical protein
LLLGDDSPRHDCRDRKVRRGALVNQAVAHVFVVAKESLLMMMMMVMVMGSDDVDGGRGHAARPAHDVTSSRLLLLLL